MAASCRITKCHFRISGHHGAEALCCALPVRIKAHTTIARNPPSAGPFTVGPWPQSLVDTDNSALVVPPPPVIGPTLGISALAYLAAYQTLRWHRRYLRYLGYLRASGGTLDAAETNKGIEEEKKVHVHPMSLAVMKNRRRFPMGCRRPRPCFSLI